MGRRPHALKVLVSDERGVRLRAGGLAAWLRQAAPAAARGTVHVAIVPDGRIRKLNRLYRRKDYATDVLSFPSDAGDPEAFLGDIVIARGVAARQAREAGHTETAELRILALHGLLHLLGYDHEHDRGRMRKVEQRLLRKAGFRRGLIERTHS